MTYTTAEEIGKAEKEFERLAIEGHAVSFSKSFSSGGKLLEAESTHYLTCTLCIERRKNESQANQVHSSKAVPKG